MTPIESRSNPMPRGLMPGELTRQVIHFLVGLMALSLRFLSSTAVVVMVCTAIAVNLFVLRRVPGLQGLFRPNEPFFGGIVLYPMAVLGLIVLLPRTILPGATGSEFSLAAAAWGILSAGDSASGIAGSAWGVKPLPWNPKKTWVGLTAFVVAAFPMALFLLAWFGWEPASAAWVAAGATLVAGLTESLPLPIDDNVTVAAGAGVSLTIFWELT